MELDKVTRRRFLEYTAGVLGGMVTGIQSGFAMSISAPNVPYDPGAEASSVLNPSVFLGLDFTSWPRYLSIDPMTLAYVAGGQCCWHCPTRRRVFHYAPVAFVELFKGRRDSMFFPYTNQIGSILGGTTGEPQGQGWQWEARVWDIPDAAIDIAMHFQSCKLCPRSAARVGRMAAVNSHILNTVIAAECPGVLAKEVLDQFFVEVSASIPLAACFPKILYDSTVDTQNWHEGCRDTLLAAQMNSMMETSGAAAICGVPFASQIQSMFGGGGGLRAALEPCVGQWGYLFPRQMHAVHDSMVIGAALTAYRALHVARYSLGTMPYDVSLNGKLQMTWPTSGVGFTPGTDPLLYETFNALSLNPLRNDGRFGFVWWVPVACCKSFWHIYGACVPLENCLTGGI